MIFLILKSYQKSNKDLLQFFLIISLKMLDWIFGSSKTEKKEEPNDDKL